MTKTIIASLVALGIAGAVAAPAMSHQPKRQTVEKSADPKDIWDHQQKNGG